LGAADARSLDAVDVLPILGAAIPESGSPDSRIQSSPPESQLSRSLRSSGVLEGFRAESIETAVPDMAVSVR
jgi:hypothetical protein